MNFLTERLSRWVVMANGQQITRSVGFAIIRLDRHFTIDEVVFAEKGDLLLLGARSLEGLNLTVDSKRKKLFRPDPYPPPDDHQLSGGSLYQ
jgi:predicted aspartyl protease